jgi:hypothetical protein
MSEGPLAKARAVGDDAAMHQTGMRVVIRDAHTLDDVGVGDVVVLAGFLTDGSGVRLGVIWRSRIAWVA